MTAFLCTELTGYASVPKVLPSGAFMGGRPRAWSATITLATQTTSDTIQVANPTIGMRFLFGVLTTDTSLGSTTVAIGTAASTAKYRAAATFTATDTPTFFGKAGAKTSALTASEDIILTLAAASMPASGNFCVDMFFTGV